MASLTLLPFALADALPNMWLAFGSFYAWRDILLAGMGGMPASSRFGNQLDRGARS
jgi:hypothetical protein